MLARAQVHEADPRSAGILIKAASGLGGISNALRSVNATSFPT